jgi:5-methyltetrahydrofolate--homocysteine methyltransferase
MKILEALSSGKKLVSDDAMGTELQRRGMNPGSCPEELNTTGREIVKSVYSDYFMAGSDIVETNSFGANRSRLTMHGFESRVEEFCMHAAEIARSVCPPGKFVGGSIGPTGDIIEPYGDRAVDDAYAIFAEQAKALAAGGVDCFFVETMMAIEEAEAAIRAAKDTTGLPVIATMTFELGNAGFRTMWGVDITSAVARLNEAGADVIGANCGKGYDEMIEIIREMRPLTHKPVIAQANAGIPDWVEGKAVYKETPEAIRTRVVELLDLGVNIIGGCCGTGPDHIRVIRELVDQRKI